MRGATIIAEGYTGTIGVDHGVVEFGNLEEGSYMVNATKSGFHTYSVAVAVTGNYTNMYDMTMTPIATEPLPWWALPLGAGLLFVGALAWIKRPKQPVVVIRD